MTEIASRTSADLQVSVEQFLYREARLLSDLRFNDWLDLFTEDAHYRIPVREVTRFHGSFDRNQQVAEGDLTFDYINETKPELEVRVKRLLGGLAHIEEPQPITTRMITNVETRDWNGSEVQVLSNFLIVRIKEQRQPHMFYGSRTDRLVSVDDSWRIASRAVLFGQRILEQPVSLLF